MALVFINFLLSFLINIIFLAQVESELRLYRLTGGKVVTRAGQLPATTVDLIVTGDTGL